MHLDRYEVIMGSDLARDGMFLELWERYPARNVVLEVFYLDADGTFTTTRYRADIPPEVETWFQAEAHQRLPKVPEAEPGAH